MLRDLACRVPALLRALSEANGAGPSDGQELGDWIYPHPSFDDEGRKQADRSLRATQVAQPAIGAVSLGAFRVLERFGVRPDAFAGHSFGELTALCAAGRIDEPSMVELARLRGRLMAGDGGDRGSMLAALAPVEAIESAIREQGIDLIIANRNAPKQSVLSGPTLEVARAAEAFARRGISTRALEVSAAFHSRFVEDATGPLLKALDEVEFAPTRVPVFANTTAEPYPDDPDQGRSLLAHQLARPVRFVDQVGAMARSGIRTFLEVGPDARLTGMVAATLDGQGPLALALDASRGKRGNVADLARALAQLAAIGHSIELTLWDEGAEPRSSTPARPGLTVKVSGANFAPKPPPARPNVPATPILEPPPKMKPEPADRSSDRPTPPLVAEHRAGRNGSPAPREARPAASAPVPPRQAPSELAEALRMSQENLIAFQRLGEQTADLHRQYLEGQDRATQAFYSLIEHHRLTGSTSSSIGMISAPSAASSPSPCRLPLALVAAAPSGVQEVIRLVFLVLRRPPLPNPLPRRGEGGSEMLSNQPAWRGRSELLPSPLAERGPGRGDDSRRTDQ